MRLSLNDALPNCEERWAEKCLLTVVTSLLPRANTAMTGAKPSSDMLRAMVVTAVPLQTDDCAMQSRGLHCALGSEGGSPGVPSDEH